MPSPTEPVTTFGFWLLSLILVLFLSHRHLRDWKRKVSADFAAALKRLGIETHEILLEKIKSPSRNQLGEVYRILHNHNGQYFLYLYTPGAPGVIQPLTEERALLAVKVNK